MILLIDNYDSFSYNLYQYLEELGREVAVYRNDALGLDAIRALRPSCIIISPGPGNPDSAGISLEIIRELGGDIPIFGVCLGMQLMTLHRGGRLDQHLPDGLATAEHHWGRVRHRIDGALGAHGGAGRA